MKIATMTRCKNSECKNTFYYDGVQKFCSKRCSGLAFRKYQTKDRDVLARAQKCFTEAKGRCENPNHIGFKTYGGRGIKVKISRESFVRWYIKEANGRVDLTIDRIDNDGHYEFGNIRLITRFENLSKAHKESRGMRENALINMRRANKKREQTVKIGGKVFTSLNSAGTYFGCKAYIKSRIRFHKAKMPDGTPIEVLS